MTTIEFCFPTTVLTVSGSLGLSQPGSSGYPRKNIQKKGKAVSRFLFLNPPFIFATYPLTSDGPSSSVSIFGFAGPGAVPAIHRCNAPWALTPHFHHRFRDWPGGRHSLLRLAKDYSHLRFPQQGALSCPDFPHLPVDRRGRSSRLDELCKIIESWELGQ